MSLKSLIQRLLDSRTTPQQAKECNDLDFSKEITVLNTSAITSANFTYIAPDAGYIYRWIQCSGKSGTAMGADILVNGKRMSGLAINNGYFELGETIRVNKGNSVKFGTWGLSTLAQYLVKFVPLGGGYNHLVRRALSCLKPSFNYSPRRFCKAKSLGLEIKRSHHLQKLASLLQMGLNTRRPKMAGSESGTLRLHGSRFTPQLHLSHQEQMVQPYVTFPLGKVRQLFATSHRTMGKQKASLFPQSVQINLQTGGALC